MVIIETKREVRQHLAETLVPQEAAERPTDLEDVALPMTDPNKPSAALMVRRRDGRLPTSGNAGGLAARVYGVMAVTALATFGTLTTIYDLFFRPDIFA